MNKTKSKKPRSWRGFAIVFDDVTLPSIHFIRGDAQKEMISWRFVYPDSRIVPVLISEIKKK